MEIKLTFDYLPVIGVVISLLAWYVPKFDVWYQTLKDKNKQLFMIAVLAIVAVVLALFSYFGLLDVYHGTTVLEWVWYPAVDFIIALLSNAGIYKATNKIFEKKKQELQAEALYQGAVG